VKPEQHDRTFPPHHLTIQERPDFLIKVGLSERSEGKYVRFDTRSQKGNILMAHHEQTPVSPILVPVDEVFHTDDSPFCWVDGTCSCHEDQALIAQVAEALKNGLLTNDEATRLVAGQQV
jgi:hypothetical protein